ncbi:uncharacterized protein LODBEIA_P02800 [Lodderomyces beijingensis]|uniref:DNA polymerase alpha subunit B n=1 Tax=Lodderomyces beijingensis TaxID=1775926 RepID=A0ABP0ZD09_9ASCO
MPCLEDSFKSQVAKIFGPSVKLADDEYDKLQSLIQIFHTDLEDLYLEWESFNVAEVGEDLELNIGNLIKFHEYLQKRLSNNKSTPTNLKKTFNKEVGSSRKPLINKNVNSDHNRSPSTPQLKKRKVELSERVSSSPPLAGFETANTTFNSSPTKPAKESHKLLESLNAHINVTNAASQEELDGSGAKLTANFDAAKYKFRTMQMKLLESADVLDDQIDSIAELYQSHNNNSNTASDLQFGNPCASSQFDILCCGRIVPDSPSYDNEALNSSSLFLETSRITGVGQRVSLNLTSLKGFSLFPGQIVVLRGNNPTGKVFHVSEVMPLPQLGTPVSTKEELSEFEASQKGLGLKIVIASGPYSNSNKLNFARLEDLVDKINNSIFPNAVILNGPFIDLSNKAVEAGDGEFSFPSSGHHQPRNLDEVFTLLVTPVLKKIDSKIQVILVPSLRDSCANHCSFPQNSFDRKKLQLPKNVKVFPNPSSFALNEVLIASSNLDIFKDLRDVFKSDEGGSNSNNRFERVISHVFDQRRYYPISPGSVASAQADTSADAELINGAMGELLTRTGIGGSLLETPYLGLAELGDSLPDIIISPSELKSFAKIVKGVVVINPGQFIRPSRSADTEDGSYAVLSVVPPKLDSNATDNVELVQGSTDLYHHNLDKRSRVDIYSS